MRDLAAQYKHVKFLTIPSTECIPNYPDENLPTLLVYHDGQCKRTIVGTRTLGIDRISPESEPPRSLMPQRTHAPCVKSSPPGLGMPRRWADGVVRLRLSSLM